MPRVGRYHFNDLTGRKFGRLTVVRRDGWIGKKNYVAWLCRCECGQEVRKAGTLMVNGSTRSCGCYHMEVIRRPWKHGGSETREYRIWGKMLERCKNPNADAFHRYGGRGIRVCDRWQEFEAFFADMGPLPSPKHEIDRIDNDGNYEPSNCRWVTHRENARNTSNTIKFQWNGEVVPLINLAESHGIKYGTLYCRVVVRGWPLERALLQPLRQLKSQGPRTNTAGQSYKKSA